jgi:hypothetical protein
VWGSGRLPQGGESPFPLPRGIGGRCVHRRNPCRPSDARRHLHGARRLPRMLPGAVSSAASVALGEGAKAPTYWGELSPIALLLVRRRVLRSCRGGESQLLVQPKLLSPLFPSLLSPDPLLLLARRPLLLPPLRRTRALGLGVWAGLTTRRSRSRAAGNKRKVRTRRRVAREWRERKRGPYSPAGPQGAW